MRPRFAERVVDSMESCETRIGTLVRVLDGARRSGKGRVGTVERTYGHPDHLAMEVRFEDGSAELYWHHELQKAEGGALPRTDFGGGS